MDLSVSVIKRTAKTVLKSNLSKCIIASSVPIFATIMYILISQIYLYMNPLKWMYSVFLILSMLLIMFPLYLGTLRFYWRLYYGSQESMLSQFYYFSSKNKYLRAFKLMFKLNMKLAFWGVIVFFPAAILAFLIDGKFNDYIGMNFSQYSYELTLILSFLKAIGIFILIWIMIKYYITPFLVVSDEEMEVEEAFYISKILTRKTSSDFLILMLSFFGWYLLTLFVLPSMFIVPYMVIAYLVHCRFVVSKYNKMIDDYRKQNISYISGEI